MTELIVERISLRSLPKEIQDKKEAEFGIFIMGLLSLNGPKSDKQLKEALPLIMENSGLLTFDNLKQAFLMYVQGKLPIEPRDNYFTIVLFNKVISEYQKWRYKTLKPKQTNNPEPTPEQQRKIILGGLKMDFEQYKSTGKGSSGRLYLHDFLDEKNVLKKNKDHFDVRKQAVDILKQKKAVTKDEFFTLKNVLNGTNQGPIDVESKRIALNLCYDRFKTFEELSDELQ